MDTHLNKKNIQSIMNKDIVYIKHFVGLECQILRGIPILFYTQHIQKNKDSEQQQTAHHAECGGIAEAAHKNPPQDGACGMPYVVYSAECAHCRAVSVGPAKIRYHCR